MKFGEIDIPDRLLQAQEKNELVIFAGAGVSYAPPANVLAFKDALERTWNKYAPSHFQRFSDLPENKNIQDLFHKLEECGPIIRQHVGRLYGNYSKPSQLHEGIVRLFRIEQSLRIATTNYDRLFSIAANSFRKSAAYEYSYPKLYFEARGVLPNVISTSEPNQVVSPHRIEQLNGIVHLHGSVSGGSESLVLTEQDFNDAYFGQNPAARKTLEYILTHFSVLFVGYSLRDPLVAQCIQPWRKKESTFAYCLDDDAMDWNKSNVYPLSYVRSDGKDSHEQLYESVKSWAEEIQQKGNERVASIKIHTQDPNVIVSDDSSDSVSR